MTLLCSVFYSVLSSSFSFPLSLYVYGIEVPLILPSMNLLSLVIKKKKFILLALTSSRLNDLKSEGSNTLSFSDEKLYLNIHTHSAS